MKIAFTKSTVEQIARQTSFTQRKSKLNAYDFMLSLMFSRFDSENLSLQELSNELVFHFDCPLRKQSLDRRFNESSVAFFKQLLNEALAQKIKNYFPKEYLSKFKSVRIQDSTSFQLPAALKETYGGCGGNATGAMIRIQFEYDLKDNTIYIFEIFPGTEQDVSHAKKDTGNIAERDLIIRDLGYSSIDVFKSIEKQGAFYISKLRFKQNPYEKGSDGKIGAVSFKDIYKNLKKHPQGILEENVYLEDKGEYPIRLIIEKVPKEIYNERIRKAEREARKKGRQVSKEYKSRAWMNIYITNTDSASLPCEQIR